MNPFGPRLQVYLSERGVASRRHAAEIIRAGRVRINGQLACEPGRRIDLEKDQVSIDGQDLPSARAAVQTVLLHKPAGMVCSADSSQGRTVCDLVGQPGLRLVPAGRLDKQSEGLVVLSNDGDLIQRLTHPRFGHSKRYLVDVSGDVTPERLRRLRAPAVLDGYTTRAAEVVIRRRVQVARTELMFTLREGRNRQIRRLCAAAGLRVLRLVRVGIGGLTLDGLAPGEWRRARADEIRQLCSPAPPVRDRRHTGREHGTNG